MNGAPTAHHAVDIVVMYVTVSGQASRDQFLIPVAGYEAERGLFA